MKFHKAKVKIVVLGGVNDSGSEYRVVDGWCPDKDVGLGIAEYSDSRGKSYRVTHLRSGRSIGAGFEKLWQARLLIEKLHDLWPDIWRWSARSVRGKRASNRGLTHTRVYSLIREIRGMQRQPEGRRASDGA